MNEVAMYYMGFSHCYGIGPLKFALLMKYFVGVKEAYCGSPTLLKKVLGDGWAGRFISFRKRFDLRKKYFEIQSKHIAVIGMGDRIYPSSLRKISDPPICLYVKGNMDNIDFDKDKLFAIVGTRQPTSYGQQVTYSFASQLSEAGCVIVSGLAMGVDTIAHKATLAAKGKTIAVLGCGVDIVYPSSNQLLYQEIIEQKGLILSEFPPGMLVQRGLFIARNRIISGLSMGTLVVEGAKHSGALITASYAAQQGRDVFAPPVPITSAMSEAPNSLLKSGAIFVTQASDILEEYGIKKKNFEKSELKYLNEEERRIIDILLQEAQDADELVFITKKPIHTILHILSLLEMKGLIDRQSEGKYQTKLMRK